MAKLYKLSFLAALMLFCGIASAQPLLYNFENCNVGDQVAATLGDPWNTWDYAPGSATDALISDEHCIGTRALKIAHGNDVVLLLGDKLTGAYKISFDMYIPEGKEGYFNILHNFAGANSVWAQQVWLKTEQYGNRVQHGDYDPFDVPYDEWFNVEFTIYTDNDLASLKINDELITVWDFTKSTTRMNSKLSAIDFYPPSADENKNGFFVDNITFSMMSGPFAPNLVAAAIDVELDKDELDTVVATVNNEGNLPCVTTSWIDYGIGNDGGEPRVLHYDDSPFYSYGFTSSNPYIEMGVYYTHLQMADSLMTGMKVTQMQYYVNDYASWGIIGPITFKLYKALDMGSTLKYDGVLLAEKQLENYTFNAWNTVVFDEPVPVTGFSLFATVGFKQANNGYPISMDYGPAAMFFGDLLRLNGTNWLSLNNSIIANGGDGDGNFNIRLVLEGQPVETNWVKKADHISSTQFIIPEQAHDYGLALNSTGLKDAEYTANYKIESFKDGDPPYSIPIKLKVKGNAVNEQVESKYHLYPNPASDLVYVKGEDARYAVIYNATGKLEEVQKVDDGTLHVDRLNSGIYFVYLFNHSGEKTLQKLVISK